MDTSTAAIDTTATEVKTTPKPLPLGTHTKRAPAKKSTTTKATAAKKSAKSRAKKVETPAVVQTPPTSPDLWVQYADVEAEPTTVAAEANKVDGIRASKPEYAALKAWAAAGAKGKRPATPNLDVIHGRGTAPAAPGVEKKPAKVAATVRFFHDAKPMPDSQNKLSSVAYYHTKAIKGSAARIGTDDLRAILAKAGIADPEHTEWTHKLANGVVLSTKTLATTAARKAS